MLGKTSSPRERRSVPAFVRSLDELARGSAHLFPAHQAYLDTRGGSQVMAKYLFVGPGDRKASIRVGIFAGIHGDEESGVLASAAFLEALHAEPGLAQGYELFVYPVCNPVGYAEDSRWLRGGADMNRLFWQGSAEPEVKFLEAQLRSLCFDGIVALHSDDTSEGLYGFVCGHQLTRHVLEPALEAASRVLPRNFDRRIDSFAADNGIIEAGYHGVLTAPAEQVPRPFEIVFETPHMAPLDLQVHAHVLALQTILDQFRVLISEAQGI